MDLSTILVLIHREKPRTAKVPRARHAQVEGVTYAAILREPLNGDIRMLLEQIEDDERINLGTIVHNVYMTYLLT